jgi:nitroimidazol reductase NimA-like FMN-containing flavoprotein (pyridoxamine 5'-phosphate oxidase superfamily)
VTNDEELSASARAIIDANRYMTLGTADASGAPWVSPVWYATEDYRAFLWVSDPEARHSRNVAARPLVSIVIFDSQVPVGGGQAVYRPRERSSRPTPRRGTDRSRTSNRLPAAARAGRPAR